MSSTEKIPAISVITPVYNNASYLPEALDSILGQTFSDFEFILVNDGSTDNSLEVLETYARRDPRIRISSRENRGYISALNEGLAMARSEFIARMDADDVALPGRFEKQMNYMNAHPECVVVGGRVLLIDSDGMPLREMCTETEHEEIDAAHLAGRGGTIVHPAMLARRAAIDAIGQYSNAYPWAEDLDFFLRLAEVGKVANVPDIILRYRQHLSSIGYSKSELQQKSTVAVVRDTLVRRGLPVPPELGKTPITTVTIAQSHRKWAWWALSAGNVSSARKHAMRAWRMEPLSPESWRTVYCAIRGH
ncbi:MAG TPA: glycosyltransferase [Candidatus Hydrogenedentes bacterium]|nr:glycosyltransferase [Candidatus Hydrogenedentota bacterium]